MSFSFASLVAVNLAQHFQRNIIRLKTELSTRKEIDFKPRDGTRSHRS